MILMKAKDLAILYISGLNFGISLIPIMECALPLFINVFLLFHSSKPSLENSYQRLYFFVEKIVLKYTKKRQNDRQ